MVWLPTLLAADMGATPTAAALLTALIVFLNVPSKSDVITERRREYTPR